MLEEFWVIYAALILFGFYCIVQDIESRKVKNELTIAFFILSFIYFLYSIKKLSWIDFIILPISILIIYYIYKKEIWGAADGKILISIMLILIGYGTSEMFLNYILNLFVFYSIGIILVSFILVSVTEKKEIIKKIDFVEHVFLILFIFIILRFASKFFLQNQNMLYLIAFLLFLIIIMKYVYKYLKLIYSKLDENSRLVIIFTVSCGLFLLYFTLFLISFIILFIIKVSLDFIFKSIEVLNDEKNYQSPFSAYLFIAAIFTLFIAQNIIIIITMLI